jgi:hypothetical protein
VLKIIFVVGGVLVAIFGGFTATIGYDIITASNCTRLGPYRGDTLGDCKKSITGIPLGWVRDVQHNIVMTIIGWVVTVGGAALLLGIIVGGVVMLIRDRGKPARS